MPDGTKLAAVGSCYMHGKRKETQIQIHKYKYTNTKQQIHIRKYKYTNTDTQIQIHGGQLLYAWKWKKKREGATLVICPRGKHSDTIWLPSSIAKTIESCFFHTICSPFPLVSLSKGLLGIGTSIPFESGCQSVTDRV